MDCRYTGSPRCDGLRQDERRGNLQGSSPGIQGARRIVRAHPHTLQLLYAPRLKNSISAAFTASGSSCCNQCVALGKYVNSAESQNFKLSCAISAMTYASHVLLVRGR